jgi:hypothetical protein
MADANDVRRLALALPHVEEIESDGFDFRVADKGFVWSYPERRAGKPRVIRTDIAVLFVGNEAEKQALLLGEPEVFFTTPGYDGWPLVMLRLTEVDVERLRELVTDAWRMRARRRLSAISTRPTIYRAQIWAERGPIAQCNPPGAAHGRTSALHPRLCGRP